MIKFARFSFLCAAFFAAAVFAQSDKPVSENVQPQPAPVADPAASDAGPSLDALVATNLNFESSSSVSSSSVAVADTQSITSVAVAGDIWEDALESDTVPAPVAKPQDSVKKEPVVVASSASTAETDWLLETRVAAVSSSSSPVIEFEKPLVLEKKAASSSVLHGNAYNTVANEAADPTVAGEMMMPHRMSGRNFAYFEPVDQEGVVSFGENLTYFFAFDNNNKLGLVTAGLALSRFGLLVQGAVGKSWNFVDDDDTGAEETVRGTEAGTAIGGVMSARLGGLDIAAKVAYDHPKTEKSVKGGDVETEDNIWDLGGKLTVTEAGEFLVWSFGVGILRHNSRNKVVEKDFFDQNGQYFIATSTIRTTDSTARFEVVPELNLGGAILKREKAKVFMGLNMAVPLIAYDRIRNICSRHNEYAFVATPNILGQVNLGSYVMVFGSASHQWDIFRYTDSYINDVSTKTMDISSGMTTANIGLRFDYEMAAVEMVLTRKFVQNPFGAFSNTDEIATSIGMFINF